VDGEGPRESLRETQVREHLANERTLLSWVRTGVGLISIALVVERAGALAGGTGPAGGSKAFALALVLLGCLTLFMGTAHFLRARREISSGGYTPSVAAYLVIVSGSLALAVAFIAYVLLG
jgi:putative membrane protein